MALVHAHHIGLRGGGVGEEVQEPLAEPAMDGANSFVCAGRSRQHRCPPLPPLTWRERLGQGGRPVARQVHAIMGSRAEKSDRRSAMLRRQGLLLLIHHLARGSDRPRHLDARHGCEAFGHVVWNGPRREGGSPDAREVAHLRGGSQ